MTIILSSVESSSKWKRGEVAIRVLQSHTEHVLLTVDAGKFRASVNIVVMFPF